MAQPRPPSSSSISMNSFPEDLGNLPVHMEFVFSEYQRQSVFGGATPMMGSDSVALPMPDYVNDRPSVVWGDQSLTKELGGTIDNAMAVAKGFGVGKNLGPAAQGALSAANAASGLALTIAQYQQGFVINPFLIMLFKSPSFKEFKFSWTLTPRTSQESDKLDKIINTFRKSMLPDTNKTYGSVILDYPMIVKPSFKPDDYLFKFKQCAIRDINVDYTGAGMPAFFTTNAPVAVKLDIHLTEIDLWMRSDYGMGL